MEGQRHPHREWRAQIVQIGPLGPTEVDELLGPAVDTRARAALYRESGGNPFYALQLARPPRQPDDATPARIPTDGADVPWAVRASIEQELRGLSPPATTLLRSCAVAGEPFEADLATEIAELQERAGLAALDELAAVDLVSGTAMPGRFTFRHPIVRRAVYEAAGDGWLRAAHARAAAVLAAKGQSPASIAPHVERSAKVGDHAAVELLRAAADHVGLRAPAATARWYRAALRLAGGADAPRVLRVPLLVALSTALAAEGRLDESREHLAEALAALGAEEPALRTTLAAEIANLDVFRGRPHEARHVLLDALKAAPPPSLEDRAALLLEVAFVHFRSGESSYAVDRARDAFEVATSLGNRALIGRVVAGLALAETRAGSLAEAESHRATAERIFELLSEVETIDHFDGLCYLVWASDLLGHYSAVIHYAERGLAFSPANGRASLINVLKMALGLTRLRIGDVKQAEEHASGLLESALLVRAGPHLVWASTLHAWAALERDDQATALQDVERAIGLCHTVSPGLACWLLPLVTAEVSLATDDPARARDCLLADGPSHEVLPASRRAWRLRLLVDAELALGRPREASAWAEQAQRSADEVGAAEARSQALWALASCHLAEGLPRDAAGAAMSAANGFDATGLVLDAARVRMVAARALWVAGDYRSASEILTAVHTAAVSAGATRLAGIAAHEAQQREGPAHDGVPTRPARPATAALSARERDIVALVAKARTNREIAEELHLSIRTVDTYVSRILTKLAVPSRTAIAAIAHSAAPG